MQNEVIDSVGPFSKCKYHTKKNVRPVKISMNSLRGKGYLRRIERTDGQVLKPTVITRPSVDT